MSKHKNLVIKQWTDTFLSVWGLVFFAPLLLGVAAIVKFTSKGPVFYIAPRVGQYGK